MPKKIEIGTFLVGLLFSWMLLYYMRGYGIIIGYLIIICLLIFIGLWLHYREGVK